MRQLDQDTVERMLDGRVTPDDAPPGYGLVVRLLAVLRAPEPRAPGSDDRESRPFLVGVPALGAPAAGGTLTAVRPRTDRRRATVLGCVLAATMFLGLAAAGALPGPVQGAASSVLDQVGVHVPDGAGDDPPGDVGTNGPTGTSATSGGSSGTVNATPGAAGANGTGAKGTGTTPGGTTTDTTETTADAPTTRNPNAATPATPANPATPADPGDSGTPAPPATPATPATPADPSRPTAPTRPTHPTTPASNGRNG